jgi:hypothetical protein
MLAEAGEALNRIWQDILVRPDGPMSFRFILQPTMAAVLAIRDGIKDARTGRSPYFWTVLHDREKRAARLEEGLAATARILLLGLVMDLIYQVWVLGKLYPTEAAIVAIGCAFLPYALMRGPVERVAKWWLQRTHPETHLHRPQ